MKKTLAVLAVIAAFGIGAQAKDKPVFYQNGRLTEMTSINCGTMENDGKTFVGSLLGTDGAHAKTQDLLCQEYTLKSDRVMYRIRPKEQKHPDLLPIGEDAQFRIKKDKLLLKVPETENKEREYIVVSMTQIAPDAPAHAESAKLDVKNGK